MNENTNLTTLKKKYPYINKFVEKMNSLELQHYCLDNLDLKTWLGFFACYINACRSLSNENKVLSESNIIDKMTQDFNLNHNIQYINFIEKLEIKKDNSIKKNNSKLLLDDN